METWEHNLRTEEDEIEDQAVVTLVEMLKCKLWERTLGEFRARSAKFRVNH